MKKASYDNADQSSTQEAQNNPGGAEIIITPVPLEIKEDFKMNEIEKTKKYVNKPNLLRVAREVALMEDPHRVAATLLRTIGRSMDKGNIAAEDYKGGGTV